MKKGGNKNEKEVNRSYFNDCNAAVMAAGCSGGADKNAKDSGGADKDTFKIGVVFYSKDDALGQSVVSTINYAAEVLGNVEIEWNICGTEPTEQIAAVGKSYLVRM